jgi:hypothetical protein
MGRQVLLTNSLCGLLEKTVNVPVREFPEFH